MHQMLFPDQHQGSPTGECGGLGSVPPGMMSNPQQGMMPGGQGGPLGSPHMQQHLGNMMIQQGQQGMIMGTGNGPNAGPGPGAGPGNHQQSGMFPGHPPMGMMSPGPGGDGGPGFCQNSVIGMSQQTPQRMMMGPQQASMTPASVAAQMEWQKLQQQFYEERRRKHQPRQVGAMPQGGFPMGVSPLQGPMMSGIPAGPSGCSGVGIVGSGPNSAAAPGTVAMSTSGNCTPTPRIPGPPPPYHQTQRTQNSTAPLPSSNLGMGASPTPPSPNPNSSLSLPSPRMSSGLSSPADATPRPYSSSSSNPRLPHPSPGSLHNTPMNSPNPRPLNPSNPGTPASVGAPLPSPGLQRKQSQEGISSNSGGTSSGPGSGSGSNSSSGGGAVGVSGSSGGSMLQTPEFSPISQHGGPGTSTPVSIASSTGSQPQPG